MVSCQLFLDEMEREPPCIIVKKCCLHGSVRAVDLLDVKNGRLKTRNGATTSLDQGSRL